VETAERINDDVVENCCIDVFDKIAVTQCRYELIPRRLTCVDC